MADDSRPFQRLVKKLGGEPGSAAPLPTSPNDAARIVRAAAPSLGLALDNPAGGSFQNVVRGLYQQEQGIQDQILAEEHARRLAQLSDEMLAGRSDASAGRTAADTVPYVAPRAPRPPETPPSASPGEVEAGGTPYEDYASGIPGQALPANPVAAWDPTTGEMVLRGGTDLSGVADERRFVLPSDPVALENWFTTNPEGLSPGQLRAIEARIPRTPDAPTGQGPVGGNTLTTSTEVNVPGIVTQEHAAALAGAEDAYQRARTNAERADLALNDAGAEAIGLQAREAARLDAARAEWETSVAAEMRQRLFSVDQALGAVREGRVDPEQFLGGPNRAGAVIAVALGQLGSALTGDPNQALQIIESRIEQNIAAQQANLQQGRAALAGAQQGLELFRAVLGDERAAIETAREAALINYHNVLQGRLRYLRGDQLAAGQELNRALEERIAAQSAVAADQRNGAVRFAAESTVRTPNGPGMLVAQHAEQIARENARFEHDTILAAAAAAPDITDPAQRAEVRRRVYAEAQNALASGDAVAASDILRALISNGPESMTPEQFATLERALAEAERQATEAAGPLLPSGARDRSVRGRQRGTRRARGRETPADRREEQRRDIEAREIVTPTLSDDARERVQASASSAAPENTAPSAFPGLAVMGDGTQASLAFRPTGEGGGQHTYDRIAALSERVGNLDDFVEAVLITRALEGGDLTPGSSTMASLRARMSTRVGLQFLHQYLGAQMTEQEIARVHPDDLFPDPNTHRPSDLVQRLGGWDSVLHQLESYVIDESSTIDRAAGAYGYMVNSRYIRERHARREAGTEERPGSWTAPAPTSRSLTALARRRLDEARRRAAEANPSTTDPKLEGIAPARRRGTRTPIRMPR